MLPTTFYVKQQLNYFSTHLDQQKAHGQRQAWEEESSQFEVAGQVL
jgi:hypothetical protein